MKMIKILNIFLILCLIFITSCNTDSNNGDSSNNTGGVEDLLEDEYYTDLYNYDDTGTLGRGINIGNFFESPLSEGGEGAWINGSGYPVKQAYFTKIKNEGFKSVRIPIRWSDYAGTSNPYTIDTTFMARIKEVVDWAIAADLIVVINVHHYIEMMDSSDANTLAYHKTRLNKIWEQICDQFTITNYPASDLCFELLNEPNGRVTYDEWDSIIANLTDIIWTTKGQTGRKIMVGTANWGGVPGLQELDLPAACNNTNTIITFHYYEPFQFTHQGASWVTNSNSWLGTLWTGTSSERQDVIDDFSSVATWNANNGNFEIFMGEFGALSATTDNSSQRAWTTFVCREAENLGFSWAYWEFCSGFGAYDYTTDKWRSYLLNGALIPE